MEFLRQLIGQVKTQLKGLGVSEKLVLILLLVIMCGAVYVMVQYSSQRQMVPLLDQSISENARMKIIRKLKGWNERYQEQGDRIMVPASRRDDLFALLAYEELLPSDTSVGFMSILKEKGNIWMPEYQHEDRKKIYLQMELARSISKFPVVRKADVFITVDNKLSINRVGPAASASIRIETEGNIGSKRKLASTIAAFVSGANTRMKREDVEVIIDGNLVAVTAESDETSSEYMEKKIVVDKYLREKILGALPVIDNLRVQVNASLLNSTTKIRKREIPKEGEGSEVFTEEKQTSETSSGNTQPNQEPGLVANATTPSANTTGTTQSDTSTEDLTKIKVVPGSTDTEIFTPAGGVTKEDLTAVVSVPLAYIEEYIKNSSADKTKQPDKAAIDAAEAVLLPDFKKIVMGAVGLIEGKHDKQVVVTTYWAPGTTSSIPGQPGTPGGAEAAAGGSTFVGITSQYGKHIAVSALALISLFMVLMMVRKASGPIDITEEDASAMMATGPKPMDALGMEESNIVDGEDPGGFLAGLELDDRAVRSQQVLEQVRDMIREEPEVAATLINKWLK